MVTCLHLDPGGTMGWFRRVLLIGAILAATVHGITDYQVVADREKPCGGAESCTCQWISTVDPTFEFRKLDTKVGNTLAFEDYRATLLFHRERSVVLVGEYVFFEDSLDGVGEESLRVIKEVQIHGFGLNLFQSPEDQIMFNEKIWPVGSFNSREFLSYLYLYDGLHNESVLQLHYDAWMLPKHFSVGSGKQSFESILKDNYNPRQYAPFAVWIDTSPSETGKHFDSSRVILQDRATGILYYLPKTSNYLFSRFNISPDSIVVRATPSTSRGFVVFTEYYPEYNRIDTMLYNVNTGGLASLGEHGACQAKVDCFHIYGQIQPYGKSQDDSLVFWLNVNKTVDVKFDLETGYIKLDRAPNVAEAGLMILILPEWGHWSYTIPAQEKFAESGKDTYIWNVQVTSEIIIFQLCDQALTSDNLQCVVELCDLADKCSTSRTIYTSSSGDIIRLHSSSMKTILYWVNNDLYVYLDNYVPTRTYLTSQCMIDFDYANLAAANVYDDMVVLVKKNGEILLYDVDKDNDHVLDIEDTFPFDGTLFRDLDNDGVGDEHDIVSYASYSCASETAEPGACTSDNVLLYTLLVVLLALGKLVTWKTVEQYQQIFVQLYDLIENETLTRQVEEQQQQQQQANNGNNCTSAHHAKLTSTQKLPAQAPASGSFKGLWSGGGKYLDSRDILQRHKRLPAMLSLQELAKRMVANPDEYDELLQSFVQKCEKVVKRILTEQYPTLSILTAQIQILLDVLSVVSVFLGYLPMTGGLTYGDLAMSQQTRVVFGWFDWYCSMVFMLSFVERMKWSDLSKIQFIMKNWALLFALVSLPPGVVEYTSGYYTISQMLRCFFIFRVYRVYIRVFNEEGLVVFMIRRPDYFLTVFMMAFLLICSSILSQVEMWDYPTGLGQFAKALWFSAVTVTTVGYGDYAPKSELGRVISFFLMLFGVGLVGTISGTVAKAIQTVGSTDEKVKQLKADNRARYEQYKEVLDASSLPYNPVLANLNSIFSAEETKKPPKPAEKSSFDHFHIASFVAPALAITKPFPICLPIAEVLATDVEWNQESTLGKSSKRMNPRRKNVAQDKFHNILTARNGSCPPRTRIVLVLESFNLDSYSPITNFDEFVNKLVRVILEPPKQHQIILERAFAVVADKAQTGHDTDLNRYCLVDPIDEKLERMEQILMSSQYKLLKRVDYPLILTELTLLTLEWDRLLTTKWAFHNLQLKPSVSLPEPTYLSGAKYMLVKNLIASLPPESKQMTPIEFHGKEESLNPDFSVQLPKAQKNMFAQRIRRALLRQKTEGIDLVSSLPKESKSKYALDKGQTRGVNLRKGRRSSGLFQEGMAKLRKSTGIFKRRSSAFAGQNTMFGAAGGRLSMGSDARVSMEIGALISPVQAEDEFVIEHEIEEIVHDEELAGIA